MSILLLIGLGFFSVRSFACTGVIVRGGQEIAIVLPAEKSPLEIALKRMKGRREFGNAKGMSLEQFIQLNDQFASSILGGVPLSFNLAGFFESAASDDDSSLIREAFELGLDRQLQGTSYRGLSVDEGLRAFENAPEVFVATHLKQEMQESFAHYIDSREDLRSLPMLGFVSLHETATPPLLKLLQLPVISVGGAFPIRRELKLPSFKTARTFHFAGGYLDSCLLQSLISLTKNSQAFSQHTNIDLFLHADHIYTADEEILSSHWRTPIRDAADWEAEREEALERFAEFEYEMRQLVKIHDFDLILGDEDVRNVFLLRHKKTKRTATIRFVSEFKFK